MYYQNYEDYIRSILGYPVINNTNNQYANNNYSTYHYEYVTNKPTYNQNIINLYPEIYKILNPMVRKICESNTKPITEELLNKMTDEIYLNIESDINTDAQNTDSRTSIQPTTTNNTSRRSNRTNSTLNNGDIKTHSENLSDNKKENRISKPPKNPILRDLIKILILNQLLYGNSKPMPRYYQRNQYNQIS